MWPQGGGQNDQVSTSSMQIRMTPPPSGGQQMSANRPGFKNIRQSDFQQQQVYQQPDQGYSSGGQAVYHQQQPSGQPVYHQQQSAGQPVYHDMQQQSQGYQPPTAQQQQSYGTYDQSQNQQPVYHQQQPVAPQQNWPEPPQNSQQGDTVPNPGGKYGPKPAKKWVPKNKQAASSEAPAPAAVPPQQGGTGYAGQQQYGGSGESTFVEVNQDSASNMAQQEAGKPEPVPQQQRQNVQQQYGQAPQQQKQAPTTHQVQSQPQHKSPAKPPHTVNKPKPPAPINSNLPVVGDAAMAIQATAEIQGVRNRMNTLRVEADKANEKVDGLEKDLAALTQNLYETEKERDSFHRQKDDLEDKIYQKDQLIRDLNGSLEESDRAKTALQGDVKAMGERINTLESAEERYKLQIQESTDRAQQADSLAQDYKRSLSKIQMDNDKLDHDLFDRSEKERQLLQQLKETEDRVTELNSSVARLQQENAQLERARTESKRIKDKLGQVERKAADYHRHSNLMQQEADQVNQELRAVTEKERFLNEKLLEVEAKAQQIVRQGEKIDELENEVSVYSENHRMMSEQLREAEMKKHELEQQVQRLNKETEMLFEAQEEARRLQEQLTASESKCAELESKVHHMSEQIDQLETQVQEQKEAYGELYTHMTAALKDLQHSAY